jgi:hypothetical protein
MPTRSLTKCHSKKSLFPLIFNGHGLLALVNLPQEHKINSQYVFLCRSTGGQAGYDPHYAKSPLIQITVRIKSTICSGMVLFLTSEVLPPLFLAPISPGNLCSPVQRMSSRSSILDLLSEHSLSRSKASHLFLATSVKGERYRALLNFISLQTL